MAHAEPYCEDVSKQKYKGKIQERWDGEKNVHVVSTCIMCTSIQRNNAMQYTTMQLNLIIFVGGKRIAIATLWQPCLREKNIYIHIHIYIIFE